MFSAVGRCKDVKKCRIREGEETTYGYFDLFIEIILVDTLSDTC